MDKKIVLISGASSGIGRATAELLSKNGYKVYAGTRNKLMNENYQFTNIHLDVTKDNSVKNAIANIYEKEGRIDVLINAAGYGIIGLVEDTTIEEVNSQFDTNFVGTFRLCKAVLPIMKNNLKGIIINISSLGGICSLPYQGFYCASKFALEGMTETLRMEVADRGIKVVLIEPGNFNTRFTKNRKTVNAKNKTDYNSDFANALRIIEKDEIQGENPKIIAFLIQRIIQKVSPRLRYTTGPWGERIFVSLKNIIPDRLREYLLMKHYHLHK